MRALPLIPLALALAACAPSSGWEDVLETPALPESAALAVLANTPNGAYVVVLDDQGDELERHWTGLDGGDSLVWDATTDNFVVRDGGQVRNVEPGGARWDVARVDEIEAHGMGVDENGSVFVAVEGTLMELHGDRMEVVTDASRCFWDVVADGPRRALSIDVMTGTITSWDTESGEVQNLFAYTDEDECWHEPGVVGRDHSGGIFVARTANGVITHWDAGTDVGFGDDAGDDIDLGALPAARTIARLCEDVQAAQEALAIAPATDDSVYVLYTGEHGEGVVTVRASGAVALLTEASGEIWTDVVSVR